MRLTCAVVETEANKVVADFSKLDPTVVQLPPFEVLGGTHAGDLVTPGKRFFQYDYRLRLIAEDAFGNDVPIPPLEISYRIESQVQGGDTAQGRDQSYSLPRTSMRLISLVPDDTTDIREAAAAPFTAIENRDSRANLLQTIATVLFALAGVVVLLMLISMLRRKKTVTRTTQLHLAPRTHAVGGRQGARRRAARQPRRLDAGARRPRARGGAHRRRLCHRPRDWTASAPIAGSRRSTACSSSSRSAAARCMCPVARPPSPRWRCPGCRTP